MAFGTRKHRNQGGATVTTTTTTVHHPPGHDPTQKQGMLSRLRSRNHNGRTAGTSRGTTRGTTRAPVTHQRRKTSLGDKISGGLTKLKGSFTRNPAKKAAGTRRMHGTDGRGSRRVY